LSHGTYLICTRITSLGLQPAADIRLKKKKKKSTFIKVKHICRRL